MKKETFTKVIVMQNNNQDEIIKAKRILISAVNNVFFSDEFNTNTFVIRNYHEDIQEFFLKEKDKYGSYLKFRKTNKRKNLKLR